MEGIVNKVLKKVISNLFKNRDHLVLQLDFEFGNITAAEFEVAELAFMKEPEKFNIYILKNDIELIMKLTGLVFNAEEVSAMFNCSIDDAAKAIDNL